MNVHRPLEGVFKFARFVRRPSGWYLQCVCETEATPLPLLDNAVGLDMGLTYLVADSTGRRRKNPKNLQRSAAQLAKAQRRLARCRKGGGRRRKAGRVVARHHERIANQRNDTLHKISREYVNGYQLIAVEDLRPGIANWSRYRPATPRNGVAPVKRWFRSRFPSAPTSARTAAPWPTET